MAETVAPLVAIEPDFGLPVTAIEALRNVLRQYPKVTQATVYGSRAKGNFRPGSDIDLCLDGPELTYSDVMRISTAFDDLMLPWKMDLSLLSQIDNPELLAHIERIGKPLWIRKNQDHAR